VDIFSKLMLSLGQRGKLLDLDLLLPLCPLPILMVGELQWISNPSFVYYWMSDIAMVWLIESPGGSLVLQFMLETQF
jgi:hypothetical protein